MERAAIIERRCLDFGAAEIDTDAKPRHRSAR